MFAILVDILGFGVVVIWNRPNCSEPSSTRVRICELLSAVIQASPSSERKVPMRDRPPIPDEHQALDPKLLAQLIDLWHERAHIRVALIHRPPQQFRLRKEGQNFQLTRGNPGVLCAVDSSKFNIWSTNPLRVALHGLDKIQAISASVCAL
jgi:hypothetical protein